MHEVKSPSTGNKSKLPEERVVTVCAALAECHSEKPRQASVRTKTEQHGTSLTVS